jgi:tetratricopeptide (TPR) repeat protein
MELTRKGLDTAYNLRIGEATEIFDQLIRLEPENPHGYVLQSVNYFYRLKLEDQGARFENDFRKHAALAIKYAKRQLPSGHQRIDALFYLGTAYIYQAVYYGDSGSWLKAYNYGKEGIDFLQKVVELDSTYYDAYLGLGAYHYYAAIMPDIVKRVASVFGFEADRRRGLQELQIAAEKGTYTRAEASLFLGNIYLYSEKDYEKAAVYFKALVDAYPEHAGFLGFLGESYLRDGKHHEAISTFERALSASSAGLMPFVKVPVLYHMGDAYFQLNEFGRAADYYQLTLDLVAGFEHRIKWTFAWCNYKKGESLELLGNRAGAIRSYGEVQKSDRKEVWERAQNRIREPIDEIQRKLILGTNLELTGEYDAAIRAFEAALQSLPALVSDEREERLLEIQYNIARIYYHKEEYHHAIVRLKDTLTAKPDQEWLKSWAHYYLGSCYQKTGEVDEAREQFRIASEFDDSGLRMQVSNAVDRL